MIDLEKSGLAKDFCLFIILTFKGMLLLVNYSWRPLSLKESALINVVWNSGIHLLTCYGIVKHKDLVIFV